VARLDCTASHFNLDQQCPRARPNCSTHPSNTTLVEALPRVDSCGIDDPRCSGRDLHNRSVPEPRLPFDEFGGAVDAHITRRPRVDLRQIIDGNGDFCSTLTFFVQRTLADRIRLRKKSVPSDSNPTGTTSGWPSEVSIDRQRQTGGGVGGRQRHHRRRQDADGQPGPGPRTEGGGDAPAQPARSPGEQQGHHAREHSDTRIDRRRRVIDDPGGVAQRPGPVRHKVDRYRANRVATTRLS